MTDIVEESTGAIDESPGTITVTYEGNRTLQINPAYANDANGYEILKQFLTSMGISSAANAKVVVKEGGNLELIKQAGPNGGGESVLSRLIASAGTVNPAIKMAWDIYEQQQTGVLGIGELSLMGGRIESAIETAEEEQKTVARILGRVRQCTSQASRSVLI